MELNKYRNQVKDWPEPQRSAAFEVIRDAETAYRSHPSLIDRILYDLEFALAEYEKEIKQ